MNSRTLVLTIALAVAGCASTPGASTSSASVTPAQTVFAAKSTYATALAGAVGYESLPRCSDAVRAPCSSAELVAQLRRADDTAKIALDAAEAAVRTPLVGASATRLAVETAQSALAALNALIANFGVTR